MPQSLRLGFKQSRLGNPVPQQRFQSFPTNARPLLPNTEPHRVDRLAPPSNWALGYRQQFVHLQPPPPQLGFGQPRLTQVQPEHHQPLAGHQQLTSSRPLTNIPQMQQINVQRPAGHQQQMYTQPQAAFSRPPQVPPLGPNSQLMAHQQLQRHTTQAGMLSLSFQRLPETTGSQVPGFDPPKSQPNQPMHKDPSA